MVTSNVRVYSGRTSAPRAGAVAPPAAVEHARSVLSGRLPQPDVRAPTQELLDRVGPLNPTKVRAMVEAMRVIQPSLETGDRTGW